MPSEPSPPRLERVLVTRAARGASALADALQALGLEPVLLPAITTVEPESFAALDHALAEFHRFDWLLFTSATAIEALAARQRTLQNATPSPSRTQPIPKNATTPARPDPAVKQPNPDDPTLPGMSDTAATQPIPDDPALPTTLPATLRIAVIGPATARALLEAFDRTPDLTPPQSVAESLTEALLPFALQPDGSPTRFLLPRATEARDHLPEALRAAGAEVTIAPAYRTVIPPESLALARTLFQDPANAPDAITFTSASTARNLVALCQAAGVALPPAALRIAIGPVTADALRDLHLPPHAESPEATVAALAQTTHQAVQAKQAS